MNEVLDKENIVVENMIYEIRGKQVMLDRDLAFLYNVETRVLIQKVKRNAERFPEEFCFQMSEIEFKYWKSQIVMSDNDKLGLRRPPYVFTEPGVAMLSAILKSNIAVKTSIKIMNYFVTMRHYISSNLLEQKYINNQVMKNTEDIKLLQESLKKFDEKRKVNEIYFNGQIYDAYSKIIDIFKTTKNELIVIDSYSDKTFLDMIKDLKCNVVLITKKKSKITSLDIEKYNSEYHNLTIYYNETFHDRYFILDKEIIYHSGTSINHAGSKTFSINILEDTSVKNAIIDNINNIITNKN